MAAARSPGDNRGLPDIFKTCRIGSQTMPVVGQDLAEPVWFILRAGSRIDQW